MRTKNFMSAIRILICLPFLLQQAMAIDETQIRFQEAMASAAGEGIPALLRRLDALAAAAPASACTPDIQEAIHIIGLLHPGSVPDRAERLEKLKAAGDHRLAAVLKRLDSLQSYYAAALQGRPEGASAALSDPVFDASPYGALALADSALRARDYGKAATLALQVIERDPYSPLLANAHMILGLSAAFRGDATSALTHFQHALATSDLPTIYGLPRDYVFTAHRFSRTVPATIGGIFDEVQTAHPAGAAEFRDPQALAFVGGNYALLDKASLLTITPEGKVLASKPVRALEDIAASRDGKLYTITSALIDFGEGNTAALSLTAANKTKRITKLRSLAVDRGNDLYFLDQDLGILRGTAPATGGVLPLTEFAPVKGRLLRADNWGCFYVLSPDQKSIGILSREGRQLGSIAPEPVAGKQGTIEYFALDALNHLYILESGSIQIFELMHDPAGLKSKRLGLYALDQRPQFRNLRVLAVHATGALMVTGKNEGNWVWFK